MTDQTLGEQFAAGLEKRAGYALSLAGDIEEFAPELAEKNRERADRLMETVSDIRSGRATVPDNRDIRIWIAALSA